MCCLFLHALLLVTVHLNTLKVTRGQESCISFSLCFQNLDCSIPLKGFWLNEVHWIAYLCYYIQYSLLILIDNSVYVVRRSHAVVRGRIGFSILVTTPYFISSSAGIGLIPTLPK